MLKVKTVREHSGHWCVKSQIDLAPPLSTLLFHSLALMVIMMMIMMVMRVLMVIMMTPPLSKYMFGKIFKIIGKDFGSFRHFQHQPYTFHIIWALFFIIRTPSKSPRWSRHLSYHSDRLYGHFADHLDTFQVMTISWLDPSKPTRPWLRHECWDAALSRCTGAIEHPCAHHDRKAKPAKVTCLTYSMFQIW